MALNALRQRLLANAMRTQTQSSLAANYCSGTATETYKTLHVSVPKQFVYMVQLNRPKKLNSMDSTMWQEFRDCFDKLATEPDCRVIVLAGAGKTFCAGIDLPDMMKLRQTLEEHEDIARRCRSLQPQIKAYQETFTSMEKCPKPVIAAVHGACLGAGVDMVSTADIRYCSSDAWFQIKEVDIGMAADVGTLQRFPKVIGSDSLARELVYTARKFTASEALQSGFVNRVFDDQESLLDKSLELAEAIASKSPVAIQVSKQNLVYSRDHSVQEGLDYIAVQNQAMLQSDDVIQAGMAVVSKGEPPVFSKL